MNTITVNLGLLADQTFRDGMWRLVVTRVQDIDQERVFEVGRDTALMTEGAVDKITRILQDINYALSLGLKLRDADGVPVQADALVPVSNTLLNFDADTNINFKPIAELIDEAIQTLVDQIIASMEVLEPNINSADIFLMLQAGEIKNIAIETIENYVINNLINSVLTKTPINVSDVASGNALIILQGTDTNHLTIGTISCLLYTSPSPRDS